MTERATGLILRTRPFTETSLIVNWLTPELGRLSTVAKGARRPKSPFRGKLDLFYVADFSFDRSRRSELHTLREVSLREMHSFLREEMEYLQQASYGATLIEETTEKETPLPAIYELMQGYLQQLKRAAAQRQSTFAFELKLLNELGLTPELEKSRLTPGSRQIIKTLTTAEWRVISHLKLSEAQVREVNRFLHGFLIYHLERIPKSLQVRGRLFQ
jgi:DNA repair protein RecO (recombination protein O)